MNHYLEPELAARLRQRGLQSGGQGRGREDAARRSAPLLATKAMGTTDPEQQDEMLELAKQIYK